jgi:hypothetical protein
MRFFGRENDRLWALAVLPVSKVHAARHAEAQLVEEAHKAASRVVGVRAGSFVFFDREWDIRGIVMMF